MIDEDKHKDFREMCDNIVSDKEKFDMVDDIKWVEEESLKRGITTYEFMLLLLIKHDAQQKAVGWIKDRK